MIEWDVLDDNKQLPTGRIEEAGPPPSRWRRLLRWSLLLFLLVLGAFAALRWQTSQQEEQIKADLMIVLEEEARSQSFGFPERAADLADPRSSSEWYQRYVELFRTPYALREAPTIEKMTWDNWRTDIEVVWPNTPNPIIEKRAYRLVNGVWRRTSRTNIEPTGTITEKRSTFFVIQGGNDEITAIEEDRDLRFNLEALRARVVTYWPETWNEYLLTIEIEPQELSPPVYFNNAQRLKINRPGLSQIDPFSPLPRKAQYRLAVVMSVIQWLTHPQWARELPLNVSSNDLPSDVRSKNNWLAIMTLLQEAEARHWALHGWERQNIRNAWREELAGQWPDLSNGLLPINLDKAAEEERKRGLLVSLLIEQKINELGIDTVGRFAQQLQTYASDDLVVSHFVEAMMGAPINEIEATYEGYILQMEPVTE